MSMVLPLPVAAPEESANNSLLLILCRLTVGTLHRNITALITKGNSCCFGIYPVDRAPFHTLDRPGPHAKRNFDIDVSRPLVSMGPF